MSRIALFRRRFLTIKLLRTCLALGATFDVFCAIAWLRVEEISGGGVGAAPMASFYRWVPAWSLFLLAAVGLLAVRDIRRYGAFVPLVALARLSGAGVLTLTTPASSMSVTWPATAFGLLGIALILLWWPLRP